MSRRILRVLWGILVDILASLLLIALVPVWFIVTVLAGTFWYFVEKWERAK